MIAHAKDNKEFVEHWDKYLDEEFFLKRLVEELMAENGVPNFSNHSKNINRSFTTFST